MALNRKLRVGLIGCGQIADAHLQAIREVRRAELVAVCDRHMDIAYQASARFQVPSVHADLGEMLDQAALDVLHVTTPVQSHCAIAKEALTRGVHVYLEKPFTLDVAQADCVISAAIEHDRLVCVGHDQLFDPTWVRLQQAHQRGELGVVHHIESVHGYSLSGPFGLTVSSDPGHWVRSLPGGLFQNVISHPLYRITEFLTDEHPRLWATWFNTNKNADFPTELRVYLQGAEVTAFLTFTSCLSPIQRVARVYGSQRAIEVDLDAQTLRRYDAPSTRGPFIKLEMPFWSLCEATSNFSRNLIRFVRSDIHYFAGMSQLIRLFYDAILVGGSPPIPYQEIRRVTAIMDGIFDCCRRQASHFDRGCHFSGTGTEQIGTDETTWDSHGL